MNNWILVSERLPETTNDTYLDRSCNVLVYAHPYIWVGYIERFYIDENDDGTFSWYIAGRDSYKLYNVTHWQPLPLPPT